MNTLVHTHIKKYKYTSTYIYLHIYTLTQTQKHTQKIYSETIQPFTIDKISLPMVMTRSPISSNISLVLTHLSQSLFN